MLPFFVLVAVLKESPKPKPDVYCTEATDDAPTVLPTHEYSDVVKEPDPT